MDATVSLSRTTCWCGTPFAVPAPLLDSAHKSKHVIYCPHGHKMSWQESEADILRRERDLLKQREARLQDEKREQIERALKAEKKVKSLKKRISAGTCPCCQRTFSNMAEHMKHQHPEFVSEGGAKVIPIKRSKVS